MDKLTEFVRELIAFLKRNGGIVTNIHIDAASTYWPAYPEAIDYDIGGTVTIKVLDIKVLNIIQDKFILDLVSTSGKFNDIAEEAEFTFTSKIYEKL
jgi:hypothetical protein